MDLKGLTNYGGPPAINDAGTESKEVRPYISNGNGEEDIQSSDRKYPINIPNVTFTTTTTKTRVLTTSLLHEASSNEDNADKESLVIGDNTILLKVDNSNNQSQNMSQRQQQSQQQSPQRQQQDDENVSDFLRDDDDNEGNVEEHSSVIHSNNSTCFCSYPSTSYTFTNGGSTRTSTMVPNAVCPCESGKCLCLPKSVAHNCAPVEGTDYARMESTGNASLKATSSEIDLGPITTNPARQNGYQRRKSHFSTNANVNSNCNSKASLFSLQNALRQLKLPPTTTVSSLSTTPLEVATANPTTTFSCRSVRFPPSVSSIASSSSTSSTWSMLRWIVVVLLLGVSMVSGRAYTFHDGKYYLTPFNAALGTVFRLYQ